MAFVEEQFPTTISYGSSGGAGYSTDVVVVSSGHEVRNQNWTQSRHVYNAALGVQSETQLSALIDFFHAMAGKANSFRYKDWADYKSVPINQEISATDITIGTGDGATATFQLVKNYTTGITTQRTITKPISGSTLIAVGGDITRATTSTTTGIVSFSNKTLTISGVTLSTSPTDILGVFSGGEIQVGDWVYIDNVVGATELNENKYKITHVNSATNVVRIDVDSSGFTTYVSGGTAKTMPPLGEVITAGFEFDVPVRFDTDTLSISLDTYATGSTDVPIVEVRV